ncbi:polyprotein [Operophtera brumata]|uniref:Polyprotein n=1 Tax=Operophtera brumata TaxID=104452 RepID=A0A0L7LFW2_OPEBR|nr:polyprotein [Operophtera brumata]
MPTSRVLNSTFHYVKFVKRLRQEEADTKKGDEMKLKALQDQQNKEIQLYQIKEKQARKMAEKEFDKMWYEVAMKESDALAARMEQDTIERLRRDRELIRYTDQQLEENRLRREKEKELLKLETQMFRAIMANQSDSMIEAEARRQQHLIDRKWCAYQAWAQKTNRDVRVAMVQQIKDRAVDRENEKKLQADRDEYQKQVHDQLEQLVAHKQLTDAQARKLHQNNLLEQIEYNKLLKVSYAGK